MGMDLWAQSRQTVIEAEGITKIYRLYSRPVDRLKEALFRRPLHRAFASLSDVSFTVSQGESLGIIGENGAGKSTLLKILAGTVTPTSGRVAVRGRVAALLELGAGFHPEFTGRQNIYLNAALLGLTEDEIRFKEDSVIRFAELGEFIDRPIKTYSSGMVVRLAFSIATSVDPDILVIDEALSVGDQYFQKKCIDRMLEFQRQGKTIVFCSHSMYTVNLLCNRVIWIHEGTVRKDGNGTQVTAAYENYLREKERPPATGENTASAAQSQLPFLITSITLNGSSTPIRLRYRENLEVVIECESLVERPFAIAVGIIRNDGLVCHAVNLSRDGGQTFQGVGVVTVRVRYPELPFLHGEFSVVVFVLDETGLHCYQQKESQSFTISPPERFQNELGLLDLSFSWEVVRPVGAGRSSAGRPARNPC